MNIDEHLKALENLATALTCKVRENIKLEDELVLVRERAERVERGLKAEIGELRGQAEYYQKQRDRNKAVLDSIAHYASENWTLAFGHPELQRILEDVGYDIGAPGEPEPFIHGDNAEGAEG